MQYIGFVGIYVHVCVHIYVNIHVHVHVNMITCIYTVLILHWFTRFIYLFVQLSDAHIYALLSPLLSFYFTLICPILFSFCLSIILSYFLSSPLSPLSTLSPSLYLYSAYNYTGKADRVISIEMFEHMKNYELLLEKVSNWLKPEGKVIK